MKFLQYTVGFGLILGAPLVAQSQMSSPAGYLTTEGNTHSNYFGGWADGRQQFANGDLEGTAAAVIEVAYRLDYRDYSAAEGGGRKWANVTLHASECASDRANVQLSPEWATNSTTTPVKVFDNRVAWPDQVGFPGSAGPVAWSMKFPFARPWKYSGKGGMLFDYQFSGGRLASSNSWVGNMYQPYYLDGQTVSTYSSASGKYLGDTRACPIGSNSYSCRNYTYSRTFAGNYADPAAAGNYGYNVNTYYCNAGFNILMVGTKGDETGTDVGMCTNLYVDAGQAAIIPQTSTGAHIFGSFWYMPWNPAYVGLDIYAQTAIPVAGGTILGAAHKVGVPAGGIPATVKRSMVFGYNGALARGIGVATGADTMPVGRITY